MAKIPTWTLGDRMMKARRDAGLSQGQIAELMGVTKTTVGNWENGHTTPKLYAIARWAELTNCPTWWITDTPGGDSDVPEHPSWWSVEAA